LLKHSRPNLSKPNVGIDSRILHFGREIADSDPGLVVLHDALDFGKCHLGLGVPTGGKWADINSVEELRR